MREIIPIFSSSHFGYVFAADRASVRLLGPFIEAAFVELAVTTCGELVRLRLFDEAEESTTVLDGLSS